MKHRRRKPAPRYPNVRCGSGHPDAPGYAVCIHVLAGEPPDPRFYSPPEPNRLGIVSCMRKPSDHADDDLKLVCAACVRLRGWEEQKPSFGSICRRKGEAKPPAGGREVGECKFCRAACIGDEISSAIATEIVCWECAVERGMIDAAVRGPLWASAMQDADEDAEHQQKDPHK